MPKPVLTLQHSETAVFRAAATIYSAYITTGRVKEGSEKEWMKALPRRSPLDGPDRRRHDPERQRDGVGPNKVGTGRAPVSSFILVI